MIIYKLFDCKCLNYCIVYNVQFRYVAYVDDVMKAIKKTEESLRKLKKIRDPNYKVNSSDDDKIRCQLSLDINYLLLSVRTKI